MKELGGRDKSKARVHLLTIGALFIALILLVTLGFQYTLG